MSTLKNNKIKRIQAALEVFGQSAQKKVIKDGIFTICNEQGVKAYHLYSWEELNSLQLKTLMFEVKSPYEPFMLSTEVPGADNETVGVLIKEDWYNLFGFRDNGLLIDRREVMGVEKSTHRDPERY